MTVQALERLYYEGEWLSLETQPLEVYFKQIGQQPEFEVVATNNWRGYIGGWEIVDDKLYLKQLHQMGFRKTESGIRIDLVPNKISVVDIFPESDGRVYADWFTGKLRCPQGAKLKIDDRPFTPIYERYHVLTIERGILKHSELVPGKMPPDPPLFISANCGACGYETVLRSKNKQQYQVGADEQPVWCKDCGKLSASQNAEMPMCCTECSSKNVSGPEWAHIKIFFVDLYRDIASRFTGKKTEGKLQRYRFGGIHLERPVYRCPCCRHYKLEFNRANARQFEEASFVPK